MDSICLNYCNTSGPAHLENEPQKLCAKVFKVAAPVLSFAFLLILIAHRASPQTPFFYGFAGSTLFVGFSIIAITALRSYLMWKQNVPVTTAVLGHGGFELVDSSNNLPKLVRHEIEPSGSQDLTRYPNNILQSIFIQLEDIRDFCHLAVTCKKISLILNDEALWKILFRRDFGDVPSSDLNFKKEYRLSVSYRELIYRRYRCNLKNAERTFLIFNQRLLLSNGDDFKDANGKGFKLRKFLGVSIFKHATNSFAFIGQKNWVDVFDTAYKKFTLDFSQYNLDVKQIQIYETAKKLIEQAHIIFFPMIKWMGNFWRM